MDKPCVSAIIVSFRTGEALGQCLERVMAQPELLEVIIVDNGNEPHIRLHLDSFSSPKLRILRPGCNIGFAAACNLAADKAQGDYIALINPDLILPEGTFSRIIAALVAHPKAWLCGGRLLNMDGSEQRGGRREILTPWRAITEILRLERLFPSHPHFRRLNLHESAPITGLAAVPAISGAFMVLPRSRWRELGGMDNKFFLHIEDIDLCLRTLKAGGVVLYCGNAPIYHYQGTSDVSRCFIEFHKTLSAIYYFGKHFRESYPGWALRLAALAMWLRFLLLALRHAPGDLIRYPARRKRYGR
jgi:N-acetylglucosaminyl-diphospho-decaprenol L-rhamnosyltransferase